MIRTVATSGVYEYNYLVWRMKYYLSLFFGCCLKDKAWFIHMTAKFERHKTASEKLADELDIVRLINVLRVAQFL